MKNVVMFVALLGVCLLPITLSEYRQYQEYQLEQSYPQPSSYKDSISYFIDHKVNTCTSNSEFFHYQIRVEYLREQDADTVDFIGEWVPSENKIILVEWDGINVGVVAHEVHHAVETIMRRTHVRDDHYGAYLQGALTECVWAIVQEDIN